MYITRPSYDYCLRVVKLIITFQAYRCQTIGLDITRIKLSNKGMATLVDTIKQGANSIRSATGNYVAQKGSQALDWLSSKNPELGGKVAKVVDITAKVLGSTAPDYGGTERAESAGGVVLGATDPAAAAAKEAARSKALGIPLSAATQQTQQQGPTQNGTSLAQNNLTKDQAKSASGLPDGELWDQKEFEKDGRRYKVIDNRNGTFSFQDITPSGNGGGQDNKITAGDVISALPQDELGNIDQDTFDSIMSKYGNATRDNAKAIADEILAAATENANREYQDTLAALGVQKKEVQTLAEQQKGRVAKEKEMGQAELLDKQNTETTAIEKQKKGFEGEVAQTKDELAQNWRDMSMQVQSIMRARGVTDSSYSGDKETKVLLDFNKGLRQLATKATGALADFAEAVVETTKFYTREAEKLSYEASKKVEDIDTWVRQQVASIQAQESKGLTQKLNEIRSALAQANTLKTQTEQSIADKQFAIDSWLVQTQVNYKNAVALAAQGKTGNAVDTIAKYRDQAKEAYDLVTKGGYEFQVVKDANGKTQYVVHGTLPNGQDDYIPLSLGGLDTLTKNVNKSLAPTDLTGKALNVGDESINKVREQAGLSPLGNQITQQSGGGGLLDTIKKMLP